jgi:hypothetical protein
MNIVGQIIVLIVLLLFAATIYANFAGEERDRTGKPLTLGKKVIAVIFTIGALIVGISLMGGR